MSNLPKSQRRDLGNSDVVQNFVGNRKADNSQEIIEELLLSSQAHGCYAKK